MTFEPIVTRKSQGSSRKFWKAMGIWIRNPHLINRRISSCVNLLTTKLECDLTEFLDLLKKVESVSEIFEHDWESSEIENFLNITKICSKVAVDCDPMNEKFSGKYLIINKFLPRDIKFSAGIEFTIIDKESNSVWCFHRSVDCEKRLLGFEHPYYISLDNEKTFAIGVEKADLNLSNASLTWLREKLFTRLLKWMENDRPNEDALVDGSLNLVSSENYTNLYNKLKQKYGLEMVKKWPECTDPNKFVYEDVAIATYLILLWEDERIEGENRKQSFVDLGCGNGLLVHILTSEGHPGTGIDLRKRQIWDIYPPTTRLVVRIRIALKKKNCWY